MRANRQVDQQGTKVVKSAFSKDAYETSDSEFICINANDEFFIFQSHTSFIVSLPEINMRPNSEQNGISNLYSMTYQYFCTASVSVSVSSFPGAYGTYHGVPRLFTLDGLINKITIGKC